MKTDERIRNVPLASIPDAALVVGRDHHVAAANSVAERLFGREDGALVGLRVDELVPTSANRPPSRLSSSVANTDSGWLPMSRPT